MKEAKKIIAILTAGLVVGAVVERKLKKNFTDSTLLIVKPDGVKVVERNKKKNFTDSTLVTLKPDGIKLKASRIELDGKSTII